MLIDIYHLYGVFLCLFFLFCGVFFLCFVIFFWFSSYDVLFLMFSCGVLSCCFSFLVALFSSFIHAYYIILVYKLQQISKIFVASFPSPASFSRLFMFSRLKIFKIMLDKLVTRYYNVLVASHKHATII